MDSFIMWKGGKRSIIKDGYATIYLPNHPKANRSGRVHEHRWVMEQHLGRPLTSKDIIHHINEDKQDNRIENLELTNRQKHPSNHTKDLSNRFCAKCGRKTYVHKDGLEEWYSIPVSFTCKKCYRLYRGSIGVPHNKR